ncbi:hypothetical protein RJ639_038795 [Escallonia herrerae]|uniref:PUM-HD domain-containing protein n=1 Tax=Escallonia herrerae TaxID=1293975 RepID=A0AA88WPA2_9ASTE|nr:hypothetical protein RJ639_038795 [Escallonia herrerae]
MEKGMNEQEFDEFEKLLGEIPCATSGIPSSEESQLTNFSKRVSLDHCLSLERPRPTCLNHSTIENPDEGKVSPGKIQQSTNKGFQEEEPNLPDDNSLTSAFEELSFKDGAVPGSPNPPTVNYSPFQNRANFFNGQPPYSLQELPRSPNNSPYCIDPNFHGLKMQQNGYYQSLENFSGPVQLAHGVQGFHLLPNVSVPGVEFPVLSAQRQCYTNAQSQLPCLHPQQLSEPHVTRRHVEEEQYYRMRQQYLYLQQLRNQHLDTQHPIQVNENLVTRPMCWNARKFCNQVQIPHHIERCNQETYWNKALVPRSVDQTNATLFPADCNRVQVLDQARRQNFPEKILTRSHGLNSLRSVKSGSYEGNERLASIHKNGRVLPNSYFHNSSSTPHVGPHLDSLSSQSTFADVADLKDNNLRLPLQRYNSVDEFTGRIHLMAKDQHGCRFLQRKFTEGTREDVEKIFHEIVVHIVELMTDPFGNYLVQKLLEVCDEDQKMQILHEITRKAGDLLRISCDMHGTRAVQKVIETIKTPEQFSIIISSLKSGIVTLIKNMNGNHVAQRCLQYLTPEYSEFIFEASTANCVELATDRHGCCVLQKCLSHNDGEHRRRLISEITSNALVLSQDPFGNYVLQFVFEIHSPCATAAILDQLEGNYGDLSVQKYSSNVVEKCLKYAGEESRSSIIQELISNPRLDQTMQDPYGNYVIQAALGLSKGALHAALVEAIRTHVPLLRTSPYGKKVLSSNSLKK